MNGRTRGIATICGVLLVLLAAGTALAADIGMEKAKRIALSNAGLSANEVSVKKLQGYTKRGIRIYDVIFLSSSARYRYEIAASNGKILSRYSNPINGGYRGNDGYKGNNGYRGNDGYRGNVGRTASISADKAREIALNHAGVALSSIKKIKVDLEDDDLIYEIEFKTDNKVEYEYEIDATTGRVLSWSRERD